MAHFARRRNNQNKLLEVEAMGYQRTSCWRWKRGVPKDKLLEVEAMGTKGQVAGGGG